jgi:hypothetical protein
MEDNIRPSRSAYNNNNSLAHKNAGKKSYLNNRCVKRESGAGVRKKTTYGLQFRRRIQMCVGAQNQVGATSQDMEHSQ